MERLRMANRRMNSWWAANPWGAGAINGAAIFVLSLLVTERTLAAALCAAAGAATGLAIAVQLRRWEERHQATYDRIDAAVRGERDHAERLRL